MTPRQPSRPSAPRLSLAELDWRLSALEDARKDDLEARREDRAHLDDRFNKLEQTITNSQYVTRDQFETATKYQDGRIASAYRFSTTAFTLMVGGWIATLLVLSRVF